VNRPTLRRPVSVLIVVYTVRGEALLLHRSRPFDFWQSVTGSLAEGEQHADAAARELREETGLSNQGMLSFSGNTRTFVIDPRWRHKFPPGVTENLEYEWRYRLQEPVAICLQASEHSEYCWCPVGEAIERVWSWTNREALQDLGLELGA
jgi:dATP pyrophosphohydrolase